MRDCPNCGRPVDGAVCAICGHGKTGKGDQASSGCAVCGAPASWSTSLNGAGPWYCREHANQRQGTPFKPQPHQLRQLREILAGREPGSDDE